MHVQQHHVALRHYMTSIQRSTWPLLGIYWIPTVGLVPVPVRQSMERQVYLYSTFPTQRQNNVLYINKSTRNIPKRKNYNHKNQRLRSRVTCRDFVCEQHGLSESGVGKGSPASVGLFLPNPAPFFTEILLHIWLRSCSIFDWDPAPYLTEVLLFLVPCGSHVAADDTFLMCSFSGCFSDSGFALAYCSGSWFFLEFCPHGGYPLSVLWVPKVSARILSFLATVWSKPSGPLVSSSLCWISGDYELWPD